MRPDVSIGLAGDVECEWDADERARCLVMEPAIANVAQTVRWRAGGHCHAVELDDQTDATRVFVPGEDRAPAAILARPGLEGWAILKTMPARQREREDVELASGEQPHDGFIP